MKQTKISSAAVLGSPDGNVRRDTGWIGVRGLQLDQARGAQMNEGGELRRESRAGIVESWNHRNEESLGAGRALGSRGRDTGRLRGGERK